MKKVVFLLVFVGMCLPIVQAQISLLPIKNVKRTPPKGWHMLSFEKDSVYGMEVDQAYRFLEGKEPKKRVVVAVLDAGCDIGHEDLKDNLWINPGEIPGNGKDDDGNGYPDDVHGWNFLGTKDGKMIHQLLSVEEREFVRLKSRYEQLSVKNRNGKEQGEYEGLKTLFRMSPAGIAFLTLEAERSREVRNEKAVQGAKNSFNTLFAGLKGERDQVGDQWMKMTDKYYGNNVLFESTTDLQVVNHGTHVAGIIGARRGNGVGMDGVADHVALMNVRLLASGDEYDKDVAMAIRYAVDNGADVINMSFCKKLSSRQKWVADAMRYAEKKGVLLVHAAGNDAMNTDTTCMFPRAFYKGRVISAFINVGATDADGNLSKYSNYGKNSVDVFAPGVEIYSTISGNQYDSKEGTSMASPMVAGVAALIMAYYPELSVREVKSILLKTAVTRRGATVPLPRGLFGGLSKTEKLNLSDVSVAGGIVNAYEAVKMADRMVREK